MNRFRLCAASAALALLGACQGKIDPDEEGNVAADAEVSA